MKSSLCIPGCAVVLCLLCGACTCPPAPSSLGIEEKIFPVGVLPATDSTLKVSVGQMAPDFRLPSLSGEDVSLSGFRGKKNVVLSFVPAAWTPVCSGQWPAYNIARERVFEKHDATLLGITVDNIPALFSWTEEMGGMWFPVLSDFHPHGEVAEQYGVLRSGGTSERAVFVIDKTGRIRYIDVHDINERPDLGILNDELGKLE